MKVLFCLLFCALALDAAFAWTRKEKHVARIAVNHLGPDYYLLQIKSVETQVVAGTMYHVRVKVRRQLPGGIGRTYSCYIKVWERPYGRKTVEYSNCN